MGYLDEAGLAALVGKVKGQMVELTAEEYAQIDPAIKNYDNKLYFVKNDITGYQIDEEPTANSNGLVKSGGIYNWTSKIGSGSLTTTAQTLIPAVNEVNTKIGSGTLTTTAQTLIPAVNEVNTKIGSTDISSIGDGTVAGAIDALNNGLIGLELYRTPYYSGTTSSTQTIISTITLPAGKYFAFPSGYNSLLGAYVRDSNNNPIGEGYGYSLTEFTLEEQTTIKLIPIASASQTWTVYQMNFLKISD